ncbi:TonB-dependent siderophore receptor [Rhizobiales bacterium RZME27]|uniref:TonB-dependent siderophore receptor n=1 Tax=Endobacterium cereale TaxID=2663029 RepID=A0A6A8AB74_9HYPH|nr:TonB-dependent siderophore receptor [Endobacterium cereale]MEB2844130.1 TonB-dependent siderophore receptor [Endobacterium cereale]MQY48543.1 TonB-dependent siderophore receptor [Endobacterium cereale]
MNSKRTGRTKRRILTRRVNTVLLSCTAIIALTPGLVVAQEADSGSTTVLQTITVQGNGGDDDSKTIVANRTTGAGKLPGEVLTTPASVSVVTAKEIQERGATSVEQVVQYTAGVVTDFYGADDRFDYFDIRGFTPYTYRDGLAIGRTFGGVKEEPYAYERLEVLKGVSSAGFGVAEPGGSVNYVSKTPKSERFGEVYTTGGSYAHKEVGFDFGDNITQDDTLSYRLTGKLQRADAEYDFSRDDENFFMGGLTWRPTDATSLTFVYDHLDKKGVPGSGGYPLEGDFDRSAFFGEPDYYFNNVNRNSYSLMFDHDFGNGLTFGSKARYSSSQVNAASAYLLATDNATNTATRYFYGSNKSYDQFIVDANLTYEANFDSVDSRTLVGVEYNDYQSDNYTLYTDAAPINWLNPIYSGGPAAGTALSLETDEQTTKALYLQEELTFADRLTVSLGLRNDWLDLTSGTTSDDHSEFTKRIGASYKITPELAAFASYGESVAPPTTGAEPTTGKQYEVGLKYKPDAFPALFTASFYDLTKENITTYDYVTYLPTTVAKVRNRGIELEAKAEVTDNINLIAAYSYIDSKIDEPGGDNDGNRLMRVPEHVASVWGTYTLQGDGARGDMTFGLGARYMGEYFTNIENTTYGEESILFDAAFTYKVRENTTFQLNVSNLFDEKHIAQRDDAAGVKFYNAGRTIMATLRQSW